MHRVTARVVTPTMRVLWVVYRVVVSLVVAVGGVGGAGDAAGGGGVAGDVAVLGNTPFPWTAGRPRQMMVVLLVSMLRLLEAFHWVMVPLVRPMVRPGVAMGGGAGGHGVAGDVTGECDASDADGEGAVVVVMRMKVH